MLVLAEFLYYRGVIGLSAGSSKKDKHSISYLLDHSKQHSPAFAYFTKDLRILVRTPTFFTHCVLANFIWPLFVFAAYQLGIQTLTVADVMPQFTSYDRGAETINIAVLKEAYATSSPRMLLAFLFGVICLSMIVSSMNSISSSAFSREGKHFSFMKYIPIPYDTQWNIKLLIGILLPAISFFIIFWPICIWFQVPFTNGLLYTIISIACIILPALLGICIDSNQPKLIWDDELNALRENYNNFFTMSLAIGFAALTCISGYHLVQYANISITSMAFVLLGFVIILDTLFALIAKKKVSYNIETQEET